MAINIFEGSRRILLLIELAWAAGALALNANQGYLSATYVTYSPESSFSRSNESCGYEDQEEFLYSRETKKGTSFTLNLCFKARGFDSGQMLIPYRVEQGKIWGNSKYSPEVSDYIKKRKQNFTVPPEDEKAIDDEGKQKFYENIKTGIQYAVVGWIIISLAGFVIGWIVRGFMGIPRGQDSRS